MDSDGSADWLNALHSLASSDEFNARCRCLRAGQGHQLRAYRVDAAALMLPLQGTKAVREGSLKTVVAPGETLLITRPCVLDTETHPDPATGRYEAVVIAIPPATIDNARRLVPGTLRKGGASVARLSNARVQGALAAWAAALQGQRGSLACHALVGLVLQLYEEGFHALLEPRPPRLGERIYALVTENPARDWAARTLEPLLFMSEASMRRHLAAEGTSLRRVVREARLSAALELLYTTRLPIKTVATRVGYASVPSFAARFIERFGVEPAHIGNTP